jgi:hypothetical protein
MSELKESLNWYNSISSNKARKKQLGQLVEELEGVFKLSPIVCIETGASKDFVTDGAVGTFLAKLCQTKGGEFHSVDISPQTVNKSRVLYDELGLNVNHYVQDSVEFLKQTDIVPNLVHLDSWDVDLKNPLPCALHGWREFEAIEDKMPASSIIIIDDNWFKGTWVEWTYPHKPNEIITIDYPVLGKGALVWHFVKSGKSNWEIVSKDVVGSNTKMIFRKKWVAPPSFPQL